jgi:hypothetical protein
MSQSSDELLSMFNKIVSTKQIHLVCKALIDSYKDVEEACRSLGLPPESERIYRGHLRNAFIIENLRELSVDEGIAVGLREETWYSTPEIVIGGEVLLSIKRSDRPDEIPESSSARKQYSRINEQFQQLSFEFSPPETEITVDSIEKYPYKIFGVITHKSNSDKQPEFISIVFPEYRYKNKITSINAMERYDKYVEELRENEEKRIRLQPSAVDQPKKELRLKS